MSFILVKMIRNDLFEESTFAQASEGRERVKDREVYRVTVAKGWHVQSQFKVIDQQQISQCVWVIGESGFFQCLQDTNFLRPTWEDGALGYHLLMMYNQWGSLPDFPMSHLGPSRHGKTPVLSSVGPG